MLNIVCTSKPCDGLFYYSYEYCSHLNQKGIEAQVYVITHRDFTSGDYTESISDKYIHCKNIVFNNEYLEDDVMSMILGRSMLTLAHMAWNDYSDMQKASLNKLFGNKLLSVYSENHPKDYPKALKRFKPTHVIDLCDTDVYPNGVGEHFEKIIHFPIYKEVEEDIQFDHLFLGTNDKYYAKVQEIISDYPDHGILTYPQKYLDLENNNLRCPVHNLLGKFKTYVYTKDTFDPAPRLFQEARWLGKEIIYHRNDDVKDGGYWYWKRGIKPQDIEPIITAVDSLHGKIKLETELAVFKADQIGNLPEADNVQFGINKQALIKNLQQNKIWFCSIPFLMAFTAEDGSYSQCNFGKESEQTVNDTSIKDWMQGDIMENLRSEMVDPDSEFKTVNTYCTKCLNDEKDINRSRRMIANDLYDLNSRDFISTGIANNIINAATRSMMGDPYQFKDLGRILEIQVKSFGIECNLDCQMCHHFSSSIRTKMAFEKGVWNETVWDEYNHKKGMSDRAMAKKPVDKLNKQITELGPYINNLKIIGGEPLVMKKHYELLDMLIKSGESKNIRVKYQTNGTVTKAGKHNIFDYIPHFKTVLITISIDGIEEYNDYIRRRSEYKTIVKNIREFSKYPNVEIALNSVVTFFSVLHLYKLHQSPIGKFPHHWWRIDNPGQMKANNLPTDIKKKLIPIYEDIPHMKEIATLLKMPREKDFHATELYKYCLDMDKSYEGTKWEMNLLDVFKELIPHYERTREPDEYRVEIPEITGIVESVKNTDWYKMILKEKPVGELWFEGITHHRIPADHPVYNVLNNRLMEMGSSDAFSVGIQDPTKIDNMKAEPRAYLSHQKAGVDFIPHIDTGYHMIFPFKLGKDYALQYLNDHYEQGLELDGEDAGINYQHVYRKNDNGEVIGILHNGPNHKHTVSWNEPEDKWWVQIIFNPKNMDWKDVREKCRNGKLFNQGEDKWIN